MCLNALYELYNIELEDQRKLELKLKNKVKKLHPKKQKKLGKINDKSSNNKSSLKKKNQLPMKRLWRQ